MLDPLSLLVNSCSAGRQGKAVDDLKLTLLNWNSKYTAEHDCSYVSVAGDCEGLGYPGSTSCSSLWFASKDGLQCLTRIILEHFPSSTHSRFYF